MTHASAARTAQDQAFLKDLEKKLWASAEKLRNNLDAANYKHIVLGLIFLKYVSDAFADRQATLNKRLQDPSDEYFLPPDLYDSDEEYQEALEAEPKFPPVSGF